MAAYFTRNFLQFVFPLTHSLPLLVKKTQSNPENENIKFLEVLFFNLSCAGSTSELRLIESNEKCVIFSCLKCEMWFEFALKRNTEIKKSKYKWTVWWHLLIAADTKRNLNALDRPLLLFHIRKEKVDFPIKQVNRDLCACARIFLPVAWSLCQCQCHLATK